MGIDWDEAVGGVHDVFAEDGANTITYVPKAGGAPFAIAGIFDEAYVNLEMTDGSIGITDLVPTLGVRLSQFAAMPVQGDTVTVPRLATTYQVRDVRPDSHGFAILLLNAS